MRPVDSGGRLAAVGPRQVYYSRTVLIAAVVLVITVPLVGLGAEKAATPSFRVIVNAANPSRSLSRAEISRLFLKKMEWPSHHSVLPVDLPEESPIRKSFSETVLGREVTSLNSYWQFMIFSGRATPPVAVQSDEEALKYVRMHPEAIGYVSASTPLEPGVLAMGILEDRH
jgi:hypothetical protein